MARWKKKKDKHNPSILIETIITEKFGTFSIMFNPRKGKKFYYIDRFPDNKFTDWDTTLAFLYTTLEKFKEEKKEVKKEINQHLRAINKILVDNKIQLYCKYAFPNYNLEFVVRDSNKKYIESFNIEGYIKVKME